MNNAVGEHEVKDFIAHYGVLGMKWGVRKARDAQYSTEPVVVKAGSHVYRVTRTKAESPFGDTFVFSDKNDAEKFAKGLSVALPGSKLFMMDMKVTKDLVGPSEKERVDNFIKHYKMSKFVKDQTDYVYKNAPRQGIQLGAKGEDKTLMKYRAYTIAVAKYADSGIREFSQYRLSKTEDPRYLKRDKAYDLVPDDYMRGMTKITMNQPEIDSMDSAFLVFANSRQNFLEVEKVSEIEHSSKETPKPSNDGFYPGDISYSNYLKFTKK